MRNHAFHVLGLLAAAGTASAAPFSVYGLFAAGENVDAPRIIASAPLFQSSSPGATDIGGPIPSAIDAFPTVAFDSYVAISTGPSVGGDPANKSDGFHANPGDLSTYGYPFEEPDRIGGSWWMSNVPYPVATPAPFGDGVAGVFLGRFTFATTNGSAPVGSLSIQSLPIMVAIQDPMTIGVGSPSTDVLNVSFTGFGVPSAIGLDTGSLSNHPMAQPYELRLNVFESQVGAQRFLINDMYVVAVPAPASAMLLGLAGLGALSRRRSGTGVRGFPARAAGLGGVLALTASSASAVTFASPLVVAAEEGVANGTSAIRVNGTLYQSNAPGARTLGGPSPASIDFNANVQFDSYLAIDTAPSSGGEPNNPNDGYFSNPTNLSGIGTPFGTPGLINGMWYIDPESDPRRISSVPNAIFNGLEALFLGRFSFRTTDGTAPQGSLGLGPNGIMVDVYDPATINVGSPTTPTLLVRFTQFNTPYNQGLDGGDLSTHSTAQPYELRLVTSTAQVGSNRYLVHDLYVVAVPSPGIPGMLGAAAFTLIRRRRCAS